MMRRLSFLFLCISAAFSAYPAPFYYKYTKEIVHGSDYTVVDTSLGYASDKESVRSRFGFPAGDDLFYDDVGYYLHTLYWLTPEQYHNNGGTSYPDGYGWNPDLGYYTPDGYDSGGDGSDNGGNSGNDTNAFVAVVFEYGNSAAMYSAGFGSSGSSTATSIEVAFRRVFNYQPDVYYSQWKAAGGGPEWFYGAQEVINGTISGKACIRFPNEISTNENGSGSEDDSGGNGGSDSGSGAVTNTPSVSKDYATEATLLKVLDELRDKPPSYNDAELLETLRGIASGVSSNRYDDSSVLASLSALRSEVAAKDLSVTVNAPAASFNDSNVRSDIQGVKTALTEKDTTASDSGASAVDADASGLESAFSSGFAEIGDAVTNGVSGGVSGAVDGLKGALDVSSLLSASSPQSVGFGTVEIYGRQIDLSISSADYPSFFRVFDIIRAVFSALWCAAFLVTLVLLLRRLFAVFVAVVRWLLDMIPKVLHIVAQ